jgi:transposase
MKNATSVARGLTIGLDVGDRRTHVCVLDEQGEVREEAQMRTDEAALRQRFEALPACRVALETGVHSGWMARLLTGLGHEVLVANARQVALISGSDRKTDRTDAEKLARLARVDPRLLSPVHVRGERSQQDLAVVRSRAVLVRTRTLLINHVRGVAKAAGVQLPRMSSASFARRALCELPDELHSALVPLLGVLAELQKRLAELERRIEYLAEHGYPLTARLRQVHGVGPVTALTYVLTLEDPGRMASRDVGPYLGLVPRRDQSGGRDPELHITKSGNGPLRGLLVQCAQYILGPHGQDSDLRRWGLKLAARGDRTAKRRAVVAVARRLAVLLHALWRNATPYEPLRRSGLAAS